MLPKRSPVRPLHHRRPQNNVTLEDEVIEGLKFSVTSFCAPVVAEIVFR